MLLLYILVCISYAKRNNTDWPQCNCSKLKAFFHLFSAGSRKAFNVLCKKQGSFSLTQQQRPTSGVIMANSLAIIGALKNSLKSHGLTYAHVAQELGLSQASIKRMFSDKHFTLKRVEDICQLMGMEFSDLVRSAEDADRYISQLTIEQEKVLVSNTQLLIVAVCLLNKWSFDEITRIYTISPTQGIQLLATLDRMKIIQLLPKNKVKLLIARNFTWLPRGPIQMYFQQQVQKDYFASNFSSNGEKMIFLPGMVSRGSNAAFIKKLEKLALEFNELHNEDSNLPLDQRYGMAVVLAIRPWELNLFAELRTEKDRKIF